MSCLDTYDELKYNSTALTCWDYQSLWLICWKKVCGYKPDSVKSIPFCLFLRDITVSEA